MPSSRKDVDRSMVSVWASFALFSVMVRSSMIRSSACVQLEMNCRMLTRARS